MCHKAPSVHSLPHTSHTGAAAPLGSASSQFLHGPIKSVNRFLRMARAVPADMAAWSVYNPSHSSIKSLGITSTWQHDGWTYHTTFHQQADIGGAAETQMHLIYPLTPVEWQTVYSHHNIRLTVLTGWLLVTKRYRTHHLHEQWWAGGTHPICNFRANHKATIH